MDQTFRWALLDVETTGARAKTDAITEIAVQILTEKGIEQTWQSLVQPEMTIPAQIQALTGISNEMVQDAPTFAEIAHQLDEVLQNCVFVAHNARFDYAFIKNAFKRCGQDFHAKVLCTVKLSRQLYPQFKRHSLDSLIERYGLSVEGRHRALADVNLMHQFIVRSIEQEGLSRVLEIAKKITKHASLPSQLTTNIKDIPDTPGVYLFYAEGSKLPIYIGKSVNIRTRVLSHFSSDHSSSKELKIAQQVKHIEWVETAGELGALLLESKLIKQMSPIYNRQLRRATTLFGYHIKKEDQYDLIEIMSYRDTDSTQDILGAFKSQHAAKKTLHDLVQQNTLCPKLCHLEKTKGACFASQLKKCNGACTQKEDPTKYNLRVAMALSSYKQKTWPFKGPISLTEYCEENDKTQVHVIDQWRHLASCENESELSESIKACPEQEPDVDAAKIIQKYILQNPSKIKPIEIQNIEPIEEY